MHALAHGANCSDGNDGKPDRLRVVAVRARFGGKTERDFELD